MPRIKIALVLMILCNQAFAGFTIKELDQTSRDNELLFEGYVGGAAEALIITKKACIKLSTFNDISKVIRFELRKLQLEDMGGSAIFFVAVKLGERFPCDHKGGNVRGDILLRLEE